jgi:hypothetical protein
LPSPLSATEYPNWSPSPGISPFPAVPVFDALSYAFCVQVLPLRAKMFTAPA